MTKLTNEFDRHIPENIKKALSFCTKTADEAGIPIFLIGGIVRDIIIKEQARPNEVAGVQHNADVDITVQGNAIEFANFLQNKYPDTCEITETHDPFKTAKVRFNIGNECVKTDLASTRKESYPSPASLPVIEEIGCNLYEDVIRRDFSINSMALSLNEASFCELTDYLGGYEDLKKGVIKVLHPLSFIDDPTRIIRGLKFSVRFGYPYSEETRRLQQECLTSGRFDNLAGERIKLELKQAFDINRAECLQRFISEGIYRLVDTGIKSPENIGDIEKITVEYGVKEAWLVYLGVLGLNKRTLEKLYLSGNEQETVLGANNLIKNSGSLEKAHTRFEIYEFFEDTAPASLAAFAALNSKLKGKTDLYLTKLKHITLTVNGNTLINMGIQPGPDFGRLLREVFKEKINGKLTTYEDELEFLKSKIRIV